MKHKFNLFANSHKKKGIGNVFKQTKAKLHRSVQP